MQVPPRGVQVPPPRGAAPPHCLCAIIIIIITPCSGPPSGFEHQPNFLSLRASHPAITRTVYQKCPRIFHIQMKEMNKKIMQRGPPPHTPPL